MGPRCQTYGSVVNAPFERCATELNLFQEYDFNNQFWAEVVLHISLFVPKSRLNTSKNISSGGPSARWGSSGGIDIRIAAVSVFFSLFRLSPTLLMLARTLYYPVQTIRFGFGVVQTVNPHFLIYGVCKQHTRPQCPCFLMPLSAMFLEHCHPICRTIQ